MLRSYPYYGLSPFIISILHKNRLAMIMDGSIVLSYYKIPIQTIKIYYPIMYLGLKLALNVVE